MHATDTWVVCIESTSGYLYPLAKLYSSYEEAVASRNEQHERMLPGWNSYRIDNEPPPIWVVCNLHDWMRIAIHKKHPKDSFLAIFNMRNIEKISGDT